MPTAMDADESGSVVLGSASVPLRPLRFLFDVEADVAVTPSANVTAQPPPEFFKSVHVRVRLSTRAPPLRERQGDSGGFLRSEVPDAVDCKIDAEPLDEDEAEEEEVELAALRGDFAWLLVRVQPRPVGRGSALRVQYQPFAACESFCLPVDHTNILRVLVTDDVVRYVNSQLLVLHFLSPPACPLPLEPPTALAPPPSHIPIKDSEHVAQPPSPVKEIVYDDDREAKAVARAVALVERDQEQRAQQLAALKDAERASELAIAREAFASDRTRLEQELAAAKARSEQLERDREQLERRAREQSESKASEAKRENSELRAAATADEALELLRVKLASDAKEREELQRRLHALQEEKLALMSKSRACAIQ